MEKSTKRFKWILGAFIFLFLASFIFYAVKLMMIHWYMSNYKEPPITVSAVKAELKTWHPYLEAAGSLKASNGVDINSQVAGQVVAIDFQSGTNVKQGDLLVQLDDSLDQKTLARDVAALRYD